MSERKFQLRQLATRLENIEAGSPDWSSKVFKACGGNPDTGRLNAPRGTIKFAIGLRSFFTTSIDAALSLMEEVLPGWHFKLMKCSAEIWASTDAVLQERSPPVRISRDAPTIPLALCAAILHALASLKPEPEQRDLAEHPGDQQHDAHYPGREQ